jgi:hypothetical protein
MPATGTRPKKTAAAPDPTGVAEAHDQYVAQFSDRWRGWAQAVAAGQAPPEPRELLDIGAALQIREPAAALPENADTILKAAGLEALAVGCDATAAELLKPFNGDLSAVALAVEAAREEVRRLESLFSHAAGRGAGRYWRGKFERLKLRHPRLFPT